MPSSESHAQLQYASPSFSIPMEVSESPKSSNSYTIPVDKAQAVLAFFEDTIDQLSVLGEIMNVNKDFKVTGSDTQKNSFRYANHRASVIDSHVNGSKNKIQQLPKIQTERLSVQKLLSQVIKDLCDGSFASLPMMVDEERKKKSSVESMRERERQAIQQLKALQSQLATESSLIHNEKSSRDAVIQQLKDAIQETTALTASEQKYLKREAKCREVAVKRQCEYKEAKFLEAQNQWNLKIELEKKAHDEIVRCLTKQRESLERQIQEWMTKYEVDTEAKLNELESLKAARTSGLDQYEELVGKTEELERLVEEDRVMKMKMEQERRALERKINAAVRIQIWWRTLEAKRKRIASGNGRKKSANKKKGATGGKKSANKKK